MMNFNVNKNYSCGGFELSNAIIHNAHMNLARIRKAKKLSQAQLAEMINCSQPTIVRAERGDKTARLETYKDAAEALDVTLSDIFSEQRSEIEAQLMGKLRNCPEDTLRKIEAVLDAFVSEGSEPQG